MPRALFTSKNLIGDGLYLQPSLEEWHKQNPDFEIDLLTLNDHVTDIYRRMGIPLKVVFEKTQEYDFEFHFDVSIAFKLSDQYRCHISEAYGKMLGIDIKKRRVKFFPSDADDHPKGLILISTFSASCSSRKGEPPNKMLPWSRWAHMLAILRQYGPIGILGGPSDRPTLPLTEDEFFLCMPLEKTARMMRDAKLVVTIDNGMGHMAATQEAPTILFYPEILGPHYILPSGDAPNGLNKRLFWRQVNPMALSASDAVKIIRMGCKVLLGGNNVNK